MAQKTLKCLAVTVLGTGLTANFICQNHRVESYRASTYHVFTYLNGVEVWKNDFGISTVSITPIELTPDQIPSEVTPF